MLVLRSEVAEMEESMWTCAVSTCHMTSNCRQKALYSSQTFSCLVHILYVHTYEHASIKDMKINR